MQFSKMSTSLKTIHRLLIENVLEPTQSFQFSLSFSQGGGDRYLVISSLLTTFQFPWAVSIREQCSTAQASCGVKQRVCRTQHADHVHVKGVISG